MRKVGVVMKKEEGPIAIAPRRRRRRRIDRIERREWKSRGGGKGGHWLVSLASYRIVSYRIVSYEQMCDAR